MHCCNVFRLKVGVGKLLDVRGLIGLCDCWETREEEEEDVEAGRDFLPSAGGRRPIGGRYG